MIYNIGEKTLWKFVVSYFFIVLNVTSIHACVVPSFVKSHCKLSLYCGRQIGIVTDVHGVCL